jgi:pimeloyl-ACP methyl ester carboxylesterase
VRYDERGYGLSDWDVDDFSLASRVADLEAVVDHARLDRFALMGMAMPGTGMRRSSISPLMRAHG